MSNTAARTIRLQAVGHVPAVEAHELAVGDTLMWNFGEKAELTAIVDASPQFLRITEKSTRTGEESERRLKKTRLVARVDRAAQEAPAETADSSPAESVSWWAVRDRDGALVGQVEAATYEQALMGADADPQVRAASPQAGGLVFMRLSTTHKAAPYSFGSSLESADVPQVKAARALLVRDGKRLAAFNDTHHCVSAGAYLDPRRETGEVVLGYCSEDRQDHCGRTTMWDSEELHAERERIISAYADLFRVADWTVTEFRERDRNGRERLARLILTPPPPLPTARERMTAALAEYGITAHRDDDAGNSWLLIPVTGDDVPGIGTPHMVAYVYEAHEDWVFVDEPMEHWAGGWHIRFSNSAGEVVIHRSEATATPADATAVAAKLIADIRAAWKG